MNNIADPIAWLLHADPALRWQAMRDLTDASPTAIASARAQVAHEGIGAAILRLQQPDGSWRSGDEPAWLSTLATMQLLRATGIDPADPAVQSAMTRLKEGLRWNDLGGFWDLRPPDPPEAGGNTFFDGEVEPCINGGALASGSYLGHPSEPLMRRLLRDQLPDGGWNCDAPPSTCSSFHSTICVLEGLLEYEHATAPSPELTAARLRAEHYLLERSLFRRRSTHQIADPRFLELAFPPRYHYDILRALDYLRATGSPPDPRIADAIAILKAKQDPNGLWLLDATYDEALPVTPAETPGQPSQWNTLRALRVLCWYTQPASPIH